MIKKTMKDWKVQEQPEGLIFKRIRFWDEVPAHLAAERVKEYTIKGMLEDDGALIMLLAKDGKYYLMRISIGEEGNIIIKTLQMHSTDFKLFYKGFCDPDKPEQNTRQMKVSCLDPRNQAQPSINDSSALR